MKTRSSIECWVLLRVNDSTRCLLLHKLATPRSPAYWQPITGGIDAGESPSQACLREVIEETGLTVTPDQIIDTHIQMEVYLEQVDLLVHKSLFVCLIDSEAPIKLSSEHDSQQWVDLSTANQQLHWDSNITTLALVKQFIREL